MDITVSTDWLHQNITNVKILDASWYLPAEGRDCLSEFHACHIQDAQFFDIDAISDQNSDLPHMLPTSAAFCEAVGKLGISNPDTVIVYDSAGLFSAARVWWMFQVMGHNNVAVLDGGLPKWLAEQKAVSDQAKTPSLAKFTAQVDHNKIAGWKQVLNTTAQIIDARPAQRFQGNALEPRSNTRSGHIPNSKNLFFKEVLDASGQLKSASELAPIFKSIGINLENPIITSCGSGVTAAILAMALTRLGVSNYALYDGSWSEWGARQDLPISTS